MKIIAYISGYDGCGYYRIQLMAKYLNKLPNVHVKIATEYAKEDIDWCDLVVIQKQVNLNALSFLEYAKKNNKKIVNEVDDNYFDIPKWNPAYNYYHDKSSELIKFYELSDGMTVTTDHLATTVSKYNKNVKVIPNYLDFPFLNKLEALPSVDKLKHINFLNRSQKPVSLKEAESFLKDKTVIGWGGSPTHLKDLQQVTPALIKLCSENKNLVITMMACATEDIMKSIPESQILLVAPTPIFLYTKNLLTQNWDIGICPIEDNNFNRSKSNLKYLEFSSRGFATVCSDVENYAKTVTHGVTGLLSKNNDESWYNSLQSLIHNKEMRVSLGNNARQFVQDNYDVSKNYKAWYEFYLSILNK